jgi:malate synthase
MTELVSVAGLRVDTVLYRFLVQEALPGSGVDESRFWAGFSSLVDEKSARNRQLLERRAELQTWIDQWHRDRRGRPHDEQEYRTFLEEIGYLEPECLPFEIDTDGVDSEMAEIAGPQLIVPATNARYALNAANARWGSLYDALYGTDVLGDPPSGPYDPRRGERVVAWAREFLDSVAPLVTGSHREAVAYTVVDGKLCVELTEGSRTALAGPATLAGYRGEAASPSAVVLLHHGLHIELVIDRQHSVGQTDAAGVADVVLEAAVTTIIDGEDSVAATDAADKVVVYRNWLGLLKGDLEETFTKAGRTMTRCLAEDRHLTAPDGSPLRLRGRALLLMRNVGHLMTTDAVLDRDGNDVPEGLLDAMVTVLIACHDRQRAVADRNSRHGSIYIVKPKMHGSEEVAFADEVFGHVEEALGLPRHTVKIGLMDEERRTSVNLRQCVHAVRSRLAFINTGFLDRTGDEIHTSMEAGVMVLKAAMRKQPWFQTYEDRNVDIGLSCGLPGRGQIGKGMWAAPDRMALMLQEKLSQPLAGASCAWVPSPTAATLHATHYHRVDVRQRQAENAKRPEGAVDDMLRVPVTARKYGRGEVLDELENNAQGILGYVVRWVDQGIGCSKVPDIHDVALMEDRATCRISSQHIANWLHHGVVDHDMVIATMKRMAVKVDRQNEGDPAYRPMAPDFDGPAFAAAYALVLEGTRQPSGYTEPILHQSREGQKRLGGRR